MSIAVGLSRLIIAVQKLKLADALPLQTFVSVDSFFISVCDRIAFMPVIVLASEFVPKGHEATIYSAMISVTDIASR